MTRKRISTGLHYAFFVVSRFILLAIIGALTYSIWAQKTDAIIVCSLFLIYGVVLAIRVFDKPNEIEYDHNFIYLKNGAEKIEIQKIIEVQKNQIIYEANGTKSKLKLPHFYHMDNNWPELKQLIHKKTTKTQQ